RRADLRRFHDLASTNKSRGEGIGFAGVGIKLGLLACEEVVTETAAASSTSRPRGRSSAENARHGDGIGPRCGGAGAGARVRDGVPRRVGRGEVKRAGSRGAGAGVSG